MNDSDAPPDGAVFIIDGDEAARDALATTLRAAGRVVETFGSAEAYLESGTAPDRGCLVLESRLSGLSGIELQDRLHRQGRSLPIVFLTAHGDVPTAVRAMKRGAFDFLEKPIDHLQLIAAIDGAIASAPRGTSFPPDLTSLTRREREVLELILAGRQTRAIAETLFISVKTVEFHRSRIHAKLDVSSMAELFRLFIGHANMPGSTG